MKRSVAMSKEYQAIYRLVVAIDDHLARGDRHFYRRNGERLDHLDQVVRAIMEDELQTRRPR